MQSKRILQIKDSVDQNKPKVSFEFFPARSSEALDNLKSNISKLSSLSPEFFSVTYGAGGTTKELTYDIVKYIKENTDIPPAAHLTCVNASKDEINNIAKSYLDIGVNRIVALRGDMPGMEGDYKPFCGGYAYADELVSGLLEIGDFDITVAAYPEVHPQAPSADFDLDHLKRKVDAGAKRVVMQYCFDSDVVLRFIDKAHDKGINIPIVPGIVTMNGFKQLVSFSKRCGATIPKWIETIFNESDDNPFVRDAATVAVATEQCRLLMQEGIEEFHFYTLNRSDLTIAVCNLLGIKAKSN